MWNDGNGQWHMMGNAGGVGGWAMFLLMIAVLAVLGVGLVLLLRARPGSTTSPEEPGVDSAHRILRERLARGEIEEQEFESRARTLREHSA